MQQEPSGEFPDDTPSEFEYKYVNTVWTVMKFAVFALIPTLVLTMVGLFVFLGSGGNNDTVLAIGAISVLGAGAVMVGAFTVLIVSLLVLFFTGTRVRTEGNLKPIRPEKFRGEG